MILPAIAIALLLQATPSSVSGTVVHGGSGQPLANVRVSLARTDAPLGAFGQMIAGGNRPPGEITLPGEVLAGLVQNAGAGGGPSEAEGRAFAALPVADIAELTISAAGDITVVYKSSPPVMTDAQGRFEFNNVRPGNYKLLFASNGFARQDYGQRSPGGAGVPIVLGPGVSRNDIVMRMLQVGAVSGRVADIEGYPAADVPVQLFRFAYDETGKRSVQRVSAARTDDLGLFRMFYLSPGRYYLSAGTPAGPENVRININSNIALSNRIPEKYALSYFPGTSDVNAATAIDVPSGADVVGIDMYLKVQQLFRVRGSVIDTSTGQTPRNASIRMNLQNPDPLAGSYVDFGDGRPIYNAADGTFEMRNVVPGAYLLTAELPNPNSSRGQPNPGATPEEQRAFIDSINAAAASTPRAVVPVAVTNADVEGLQLRVGTTGSITGILRVEQSAAGPAPDLNFMRVSLRPVQGGTSAASQQDRPIQPDGSFRLERLLPNDYDIIVIGLPSGYYLKEARLGDLDLLNGPWRYSGSGTGAMNILISLTSGQVDGVVSDGQGRPVAGARAVLIPERNRERTGLFRSASTDPSGRFNFSGVAPGDYKLVAWEAIEPFAFFDPDLLKQADDAGKPLRVSETSKQTINVSAFR